MTINDYDELHLRFVSDRQQDKHTMKQMFSHQQIQTKRKGKYYEHVDSPQTTPSWNNKIISATRGFDDAVR